MIELLIKVSRNIVDVGLLPFKFEFALPMVNCSAQIFPFLRNAPFALVHFGVVTTDALAIVQFFAAFGVTSPRRCR